MNLTKLSLDEARQLDALYEAGFKAKHGVGESAFDHVAKTLNVPLSHAHSAVMRARRMLEGSTDTGSQHGRPTVR